MSNNTVEHINTITIDVFDGYFTVKTEKDMTVEEMYTILVGSLQHLEDFVEGELDSNSSTMLQ